MTTTRIKITAWDLPMQRITFESLESSFPRVDVGDTALFIDQATVDRTLAFDAELVRVDPVEAVFVFKALGLRAGGRGVDFHAGDKVRLMVRTPADLGPGITPNIPGQPDIGDGVAEAAPMPKVATWRDARDGGGDPTITDPQLRDTAVRIAAEQGLGDLDMEGAAAARLDRLMRGESLATVYRAAAWVAGRSGISTEALRDDLAITLARSYISEEDGAAVVDGVVSLVAGAPPPDGAAEFVTGSPAMTAAAFGDLLDGAVNELTAMGAPFQGQRVTVAAFAWHVRQRLPAATFTTWAAEPDVRLSAPMARVRPGVADISE